MWYVMVFADMRKTECVKVMEFATIKTAAAVLGLQPQVVSNFYHRLIKPRHALRYIAMFKG
jgi:hypothetical protein|eukprot:COSAG01_NODE_809_length_13431_cov_12.268677_15_plen_61_part_00